MNMGIFTLKELCEYLEKENLVNSLEFRRIYLKTCPFHYIGKRKIFELKEVLNHIMTMRTEAINDVREKWFNVPKSKKQISQKYNLIKNGRIKFNEACGKKYRL